MLRDKIKSCDAVLHIVGIRYGAEPNPATLPEGKNRLSYNKHGDVQLRLGDTKSALEFYQQALDSRKQLVAHDPKDSECQRGLFVNFYKLSTLYRSEGHQDPAQAISYLLKAHAQLIEMKEKGILAPDDERFIEMLAEEIETISDSE